MARVTLVTYAAKPEHADENEALSRAVFAELRDKAPPGLNYALFRDGADFVHLFVNFDANESSPLTELASFKAFSSKASDRQMGDPAIIRLDAQLVEAYGAPIG